MIDPILEVREMDHRSDRLPDLWRRRRETRGGGREEVARGLWRTGPQGALRSAVVAGIDQARQVVLVASFLLADAVLVEAMLRAAARGVRVYVLTASEQRVARAPAEDEQFESRMVEEHKQLLQRLAGKTLLRSAEHFHAKFVVVDPPWANGGPTRGWLSTANFNPALLEGVELGVEMDAPRATSAATVFAHAFWNEAERELVDVDRLGAVAAPPLAPAIAAHEDVLVTARGTDSLRSAAQELIAGARRELLVACYGLDVGHPSVVAIAEAARRGVAVTLLTRPRPAVQAAARLLAEAGARVVAHDKLHAKAIVADGGGLVMTANLQAHGLDQGFELGLRVPQGSPLREVLAEWGETFPWEFLVQPTRSQCAGGEVWFASNPARAPKSQVVERARVELPPVVAPDALALDQAPDPELKPPPLGNSIPCVVRYEWEVRPPRLPGDAKQRPGDGIPVYEHRGMRYVRLRSLDEAEAARRLADQIDGKVVL